MKHLKSLFFFFLYSLLVLFYSISGVYASENIDVTLSDSNIAISDTFQLEVRINSSIFNNENISLEIPGIENFEIFSQTQGYNFQEVNGTSQSQTTYTLDLRASKLGTFDIGPVKVISSSLSEIDDAVLSIQVSDNSGSLGSSPIQAQTQNINQSEAETPKIQEQEIQDIRRAGLPFLGIIAAIILIIIIFYSLLRYILQNKEEKKNHIPVIEHHVPQEDFNVLMKKYFIELETKIESEKTEVFFQKYNLGIRNILVKQHFANALTSTLQELQEYNIVGKNEFLKLFEESYFGEYSEKEISKEKKKQFIEDAIRLLDTTI